MRNIWSGLLLGLLAGTGVVVPDGAHASVTAVVVSPKMPLNVRSGPAVWTSGVRTAANQAPVTIVCQVHGQRITQGSVRVTDLWDRLADGTYVSDAWISRSGAVPACTASPASASSAQPAPAVPAVPTTIGVVASGDTPLKARTGPAHDKQLVTALPDGTAVSIVCQQRGEAITGTIRTSELWDRLADGTYVSDAYVRRGSTPPACAAAPTAPAAGATPAAATTSTVGGWVNPTPGFPAERSFRTKSMPNHLGVNMMAFTGTPIHAAAAGTVLEVVCNIEPGYSCDKSGSAAIRGCGWYVKIGHADHVATIYCHMARRGSVTVGQHVNAGQVIGYVGSSGNSSAPHLHFEVHTAAPPTGPWNAVDPIPFMRERGAPIGR